jgi:glycosyltransferase involved in cell wall biosynthesis
LKEDQINSKQLKVVILTSRFPYPLDKGDKLRIYHHIKELSKYTSITLICLCEEPITVESIDVLSPYCTGGIHAFQLSKRKRVAESLRYFIKGRPMQVGYFFSSEIKERINWIIDELEPDHVHCHMVRMIPYIRFKKNRRYSLDYMDSMVLNDMASQHIKGRGVGILRYMERKRIAAFETKFHISFDHHFIISQRDRIQMNHAIQEDIEILSNGVETKEVTSLFESQKEYDLCFCGNLGYVPNQKAIDIILNDILPQLRTSSIVLAGSDAPSYLSSIREEYLTILSPVDDMSDIYMKSRILIAPIFTGSGQQNKILEAMALGVPCITTSFVNESIGANNGDEILIADEAKSFIEGVKVLFSHSEIYAEISRNGKALVERRFDWCRNTKPLIDAILNSN